MHTVRRKAKISVTSPVVFNMLTRGMKQRVLCEKDRKRKYSPLYVGSVKRSDLPTIANNDRRLILRRMGQRHDRVQTESQELQPWTAVSILAESRQHGVASYEVISWSTDHPQTH